MTDARKGLSTSISDPAGSPRASDLQPSTPPRLNPLDKQRLALALSRVCALQKQYGKTRSELETLVEGFYWILAEYPVDRILTGIQRYVKRHPDIPSPSDIANIIDPDLAAMSPTERDRKQREGAVTL